MNQGRPSHPVAWETASPLWPVALEDSTRRRFHQPALLRFAQDTFMEDLAALLAGNPAGLKDYVVRFETWENPNAGWQRESDWSAAAVPKLYQATHGRHYLVAGSLVCRIAGLPDRRVEPAHDEKTSIVVRRLVARETEDFNPQSAATYDEYAWVTDTAGQNLWVKVDSGASDAGAVVADGTVDGQTVAEERIPMFGMSYVDGSQPRRLWLALLPVASRQAGSSATAASPVVLSEEDAGSDTLGDPREAQFEARVMAPLAELRKFIDTGAALTDSEMADAFLFSLAEFSSLLDEVVPVVFDSGSAGPSGGAESLFTLLRDAVFLGSVKWWDALREVRPQADAILSGEAVSSMPAEGMTKSEIRDALSGLGYSGDNDDPFPALKQAFGAALAEAAESRDEAVEAVLPESPKLDPADGTYYVARCVWDRPLCGRLQPPLVSAATTPFQLASFFDPDAPARPLRVSLPVDTSPAGLRKFPRNVAFLVSDQLRKQMNRVQGVTLGDLDDGKIGSEDSGIRLGMICSFSIPIITICALILLLIIVFVLNIVFWWLPFFRICLPLKLTKS